jgi:DNA-directed RNA polymerase specialized sigma24 family protein
MGARRGGGERGPGLAGRSGPGPRGKGGARRHRKAPAGGRTLSLAEAQFYARVYDPARKGSLAELRRRGCDEHEAEELFAAAYAKVMESIDPIERRFSAPQMVRFVKRSCWYRLVDERRRLAVRGESRAKPSRSRPESPVESPPELADEREAVAIGREALAMLPERDRLIFLRRHLLGMVPEEILAETPGLSMRTYRKIVQRANVRVQEAFERIEAGERCAEMEGALLGRYVFGESPPAERRVVEAHLDHCRACGQACARMRDHLLDVASGALLASSLGAGRPGAGALLAHLPEHVYQGVQALGEASRAARERLREALLRLVGSLPGPGADPGVSQALGASSWRIASACTTAVAAGACVAAGVVPGIGGVELSGHRHHHNAAPAREVRAESAPRAAARSKYVAPVPTTSSSAGTSSGTPVKRTATAKRESTNASRERTSAAPTASGRQVATEFGPESTQPAPSSGTSSPSPSSSGATSTSVSGAAAAKSAGSGSGGGSTGTTRSSSEFGF